MEGLNKVWFEPAYVNDKGVYVGDAITNGKDIHLDVIPASNKYDEPDNRYWVGPNVYNNIDDAVDYINESFVPGTSEYWNEIKESKREKKLSNLEYNTISLIENNINFDSRNDGVHLMVYIPNSDEIVDFYPSTGLIKFRDGKKNLRGIKNLLRYTRDA